MNNDNTNINCDYCKHYNWYYDYCDKWKCEIDARSIYGCFEPNDNNNTEVQHNEY